MFVQMVGSKRFQPPPADACTPFPFRGYTASRTPSRLYTITAAGRDEGRYCERLCGLLALSPSTMTLRSAQAYSPTGTYRGGIDLSNAVPVNITDYAVLFPYGVRTMDA